MLCVCVRETSMDDEVEEEDRIWRREKKEDGWVAECSLQSHRSE